MSFIHVISLLLMPGSFDFEGVTSKGKKACLLNDNMNAPIAVAIILKEEKEMAVGML